MSTLGIIAGWLIASIVLGSLIGRCISFGSGCKKGDDEC